MSETQLQELVAKRGGSKAQLTRFKNYMEGLTVEELSSDQIYSQVDSRLNKMGILWNTFDAIQSDIDDISIDIDAQNIERDSFEREFFNLESKMKSILNKQKTVNVSNNTNSTPIVEQTSSAINVRLPTIELPTFDGKFHKWLEFKNSFNGLIHDNDKLSATQKFFYLKSALKGEAAVILQNLSVSDANYETARELLKKRFENTQAIISNHLKAIFDIYPLQKESLTGLRALYDISLKNIRSLQAMHEPAKQWDLVIIHVLINKLDSVTRKEWERESQGEELPTLDKLHNFLLQRCLILENINTKQEKSSFESKFKQQFNKSSNQTYTAFSNSCPLCKNNHPLYKCEAFKKYAVKDRIDEVKRLKICTNCLRGNHKISECKFSNCQRCGERHNTLLHVDREQNGIGDNVSAISNSQKNADPNKRSLCTQKRIKEFSQTVLSTAMLLITDNNGKYVKCRALLDSGSDTSLISESFINKLKLPMKHHVSSLIGISQTTSQLKYAAQVEISAMHNSYSEKVECLVVPTIADITQTSPINREDIGIPKHLLLADPEFYKGGAIDILLGSDLFWEILRSGRIKLNKYGPILQNTIFGWIVGGNINLSNIRLNKHFCQFSKNDKDAELNNLVRRFWAIEEISVPVTMSEAYLTCEQLFANTYKRDQNNGRFIVKIPFNDKLPLLGNSRETAKHRFSSLERRFKKDNDLKEQYVEFMNEYIEMGHMYEINEYVDNNNSNCFYLPHQPVFKQVGAKRKIRVVFDASAKSDSGLSLNDVQHTGPALLNEIFSILLNFRKYAYAMSADIVKMYRMIDISSEQRKYQRILWRNDSAEPLKCYELKTVTYGTASAPFLAVRTLHQIAKDYHNEYPVLSRIIKKQFYMDDILMGADTIEEALEIKTKLVNILGQANFKLDKWLTNFSQETDIGRPVDLDGRGFKILGVSWNTVRDELCYSFEYSCSPGVVTKRKILSIVAQLFDPYGLLAPIIISGKIILQGLWVHQSSWDDKITDDVENVWLKYVNQLKFINEIRVSRFVLSKDVNICEIHGFSDASQKAYGACIYIRSINKEGEITSNLLCARSKVAPLKTISVPRLELCAALLLAKLFDHVKRSIDMKFDNVYLWCDSTIVLCWLRGEPSNWKVFVANRVSKIQSITSIENWNHVNTVENPADLVSRGVEAKDLINNSLWFKGPHWMSKQKEDWPINSTNFNLDIKNLPDMNQRTVHAHTIITQNKFDLFEKYSSYRKLRRIFAYVLRFISNLKLGIQKQPLCLEQYLSIEELQNSQFILIKIAQNEYFYEDIKCLQRQTQVPTRSNIAALNPFLDETNILRVGGRLVNSTFAYEKIHPILLPPKHTLSKLIAVEEHVRLLHAAPQLLLASLREKYWPINGRNLCKVVVKECIVCFKANPKNTQPIMGNLPAERVAINTPFYNVGVDYAGPFLIKERKFRNTKLIKCYASLFVCLSTKAIHIELVGDLTADTFIAAIRRFIARRGRPQTIWSDNGTNFVGAYADMKRIINFLKDSEDKIQRDMSTENINWKFIPPRAPNFGGLWEAAVRSMKLHLRKIVGNLHLTFEELYTLLVQIEGILNSRPLFSLSNDPNDYNPLTPAHFILGRAITSIPDKDVTEIQTNRLKRYQLIQQGLQHFWRRWSREYVTQLQARSRWKTSTPTSIQLGSLVLVQEDGTPPYRWPLGRIKQLHPGNDGIIRVVTIQLKGTTIKRPVSKICILPLKTDVEESGFLQGGQDVGARTFENDGGA